MYGLIKTIQIWWLLMKNKRHKNFSKFLKHDWKWSRLLVKPPTYYFFLSLLVNLSSNVGQKTQNLCLHCQVAGTGWKIQIITMSCFRLLLSFWFSSLFFWYKKSSTNHKLVHTNSYMHFLFWGRIKRHCFRRGVRVPLGDTGSVTFLILVLHFTPPYFLLSFNWWNLHLCILKMIQTHEKSKSLRFMYLLKAMLSNWGVSLSLKA